MRKIPTLDIVSAACAAYRTNSNAIVTELGKSHVPNRELIKSYFNDNKHGLEVREEDRVHAESIIDQVQHQATMAALTGVGVTDYSSIVRDLITHPVVPTNRIGVVQWLPRYCADFVQAQDVRQQLGVLSYSSKYLGKPKDHVEIDFVTITKRYNTIYQAWRYTGHDNHGNLVGFLSKLSYNKPTFKIKGRIKRTVVSKFAEGGKTTFLAKVKEVTCQDTQHSLSHNQPALTAAIPEQPMKQKPSPTTSGH